MSKGQQIALGVFFVLAGIAVTIWSRMTDPARRAQPPQQAPPAATMPATRDAAR